MFWISVIREGRGNFACEQYYLPFLILVQIETAFEEKEKDELSIKKHKLSQPEGLSVHTHWKTTTLPQKCSLTASLRSLLRVQSAGWLACWLSSTSPLHKVMKKTHWLEKGNELAVVERK